MNSDTKSPITSDDILLDLDIKSGNLPAISKLELIEPVDPKNPTHYVDNAKFYAALKEYHAACALAKSEGKEQPIIPNYIGKCFMEIAAGVAMKHNFRNYSYIKDMQSAGVEVCVKHVLSFDPEKGNNPFAYYTTTIWYAFLGIIKREKKAADIKRRAFLLGGFDTYDIQDLDDDSDFKVSYIDYLKSFDSDTDSAVKSKKTPKKKKGSLDAFVDDSK